ncbi:MAG: single-stranded DNA-binding protein [Candidatus Bruticola sp.]
MSVLNRVILIGRLVRDPEVRTTPSGKQTARFTLAVDRRSRNSEKSADFIPITTWESVANFCANYLRKGRQVAVEGRLQINTKEENGTYRTFVEVVADDVQALGSKSDVQPAAVGGSNSYSSSAAPDPLNDGLDDDFGGESDMDVPF